jgi:hypothetical protein
MKEIASTSCTTNPGDRRMSLIEAVNLGIWRELRHHDTPGGMGI